LVSGRGVITRVPQREQNAEFAVASNPHWGHLMVDQFRRVRSEFRAWVGLSRLWIRSA
jgi:hypothetical protein